MNEQGKVVKEYLKKFPSGTNLGISRKLFKDYPLLFKSVDAARTIVRYYRGQNGSRNRKRASEIIEKIPIPESDAEDWTPYIIPKSIKNLLILSDIHVPYHDVKALEVCFSYAEKKSIDAILINGDLFDFYKGSRFEQNPYRRSMALEIDLGCQLIQHMKQRFQVPIYVKYGNHDERWDKYIMLKAPELFNLDGVRLEDRIRSKVDVEIIYDKRIVKHGHLDILHGHEFFGAPSQAVNPARGLFMKTLDSCLIGHLHKSSSHTETTLSGKMITTHSMGCLCHLNPEYARINKWNHGFAINEITQNGEYVLHNKRIANGKVY